MGSGPAVATLEGGEKWKFMTDSKLLNQHACSGAQKFLTVLFGKRALTDPTKFWSMKKEA